MTCHSCQKQLVCASLMVKCFLLLRVATVKQAEVTALTSAEGHRKKHSLCHLVAGPTPSSWKITPYRQVGLVKTEFRLGLDTARQTQHSVPLESHCCRLSQQQKWRTWCRNVLHAIIVCDRLSQRCGRLDTAKQTTRAVPLKRHCLLQTVTKKWQTWCRNIPHAIIVC